MKALLDTNILIAQSARREDAADLSGFDRLFVSSLSWTELTKGLHTTTALPTFKARLARIEALRRVFGHGIPFDDDCVAAYDDILRRVTARGGSARAHTFDRMLAATAAAHGLTVVTRDRAGFAGLEGLVEVELR